MASTGASSSGSMETTSNSIPHSSHTTFSPSSTSSVSTVIGLSHSGQTTAMRSLRNTLEDQIRPRDAHELQEHLLTENHVDVIRLRYITLPEKPLSATAPKTDQSLALEHLRTGTPATDSMSSRPQLVKPNNSHNRIPAPWPPPKESTTIPQCALPSPPPSQPPVSSQRII